MAVQIPDPGTGNGQTGDNEYVFRKKVKDNFSDPTNAASRLVGDKPNRVLEYGSLGLGAPKSVSALPTEFGFYSGLGAGFVLPAGMTTNTSNSIVYGSMLVSSRAPNTNILSFGVGEISLTEINATTKELSRYNQVLTSNNSKFVYDATTAAGANMVIDSTGKIMRSTSSERYKDILAPLELDDARYQDAMALKPIVYRSTADADNPAYHYYSFSAEELGAYDPAFTLWRETDIKDADGNVTEQPLAERQAEGININALLAMSHAISIKQDKIIKALEARIEILEAK